ncbi:hypothetical protein A5881_000967 [Enterococcus termitis]|nr:hypothetical protein A5881_001178 [Enterococcus termitis]
MKKSLKIMSALLLFSSVAFSTPAVNSIVHAEESTAPMADDSSALRGQLQDLVNQANATLATPDLYTPESIESLKTSVSNAQVALDTNMESSYQTFITSMNIALAKVVAVTPPSSTEEPSSTDSSSTEPSSTDPSSTEPSSTDPNSTDSSSTQPSSTDSSSTQPSSTDSSSTQPSSTDSSSTQPSSTESSSTESSSTDSSSSEEVKPSIEISNQTMYVGQKLTEEIILSWATFNNAEGYMVGFEVVGDSIQVTALGNLLVTPGTHTIRFYVSKVTRSTDNIVAEKEITLTVLPESDKPKNPFTPVDPTANSEKTPEAPTNDLISEVVSPVSTSAKKPISSTQKKAKQLPSTGESNNGMMIASAGVMLIAGGAYIFRKKQVAK